jgi:hypothetical protein
MRDYGTWSTDVPRFLTGRADPGRHFSQFHVRKVSLALAAVVSLLAIGSSAIPAQTVQAVPPARADTPPGPAIFPEAIAPLNATDCGLFSSEYFNGTVSSLGWPPSYAEDVQIMYDKICNNSTFVTLLSEWGGWHWISPVTENGTTTPGYWAAANFTVQFGGSGPPSPWSNSTAFVVTWISDEPVPPNVSSFGKCRPCEWQEDWVGSLPGTNYTGPNIIVYPPIPTGGPSGGGSAGPSGYFLGLPSAWFVGVLSGVAILAATSALLVSRRRASQGSNQPGTPAMDELPGTSGQRAPQPEFAQPGPSQMDRPSTNSIEPSDPLDDAF